MTESILPEKILSVLRTTSEQVDDAKKKYSNANSPFLISGLLIGIAAPFICIYMFSMAIWMAVFIGFGIFLFIAISGASITLSRHLAPVTKSAKSEIAQELKDQNLDAKKCLPSLALASIDPDHSSAYLQLVCEILGSDHSALVSMAKDWKPFENTTHDDLVCSGCGTVNNDDDIFHCKLCGSYLNTPTSLLDLFFHSSDALTHSLYHSAFNGESNGETISESENEKMIQDGGKPGKDTATSKRMQLLEEAEGTLTTHDAPDDDLELQRNRLKNAVGVGWIASHVLNDKDLGSLPDKEFEIQQRIMNCLSKIIPQSGSARALFNVSEKNLQLAVQNRNELKGLNSVTSIEPLLRQLRSGLGGYLYSAVSVFDLCDPRLVRGNGSFSILTSPESV